jgi:large subunit ribosomal protein L19e
MRLNTQKKLAAGILKSSPKKIWLDSTRSDEIKEAITKADIRSLIKDKAIKAKKEKGTSKSRIRKAAIQKSKGRRKGPGSRKSGMNARITRKRTWINHIRVQRALLQNLREKKVIGKSDYRSLYLKSKGGFFRSKRHLKMYIEERGIIKK